jgi:hypothetical protein
MPINTVHLVLQPRIMLWYGRWVVAKVHVPAKEFKARDGIWPAATAFCKERNRREGR